MQKLDQWDNSAAQCEEAKISGFDRGARSLFKEPTLYLSILGFLLVSFLALGNTPMIFWAVFFSLSAISVVFHIIAERYIFSKKTEFQHFAIPYEGVFIVTFGALLPGISLLAYSLYSLCTIPNANYLHECAKIMLLMTVPVFNFIVWSAVRRKYLPRPRLIGMMNGVSIGLSLSWSLIWLKTCFFSATAASCKFGWMFLLCVSPFLFVAAIFLQNDLCRKTEEKIGRITLSFSLLGLFLSLLFIFTPSVHILTVQSALTEARNALPDELAKCITYIKSIASDEDLRPSDFPVSGSGLGGLLIPDRGLEGGSDKDKELYFRIKGVPYHELGKSPYDPKTWKPEEVLNTNALIGSKVKGLSLSKSQLIGKMDTRTMTATIDWVMTFSNASGSDVVFRAEISMPQGAVVNGATMWLNGRKQLGIFVATQIPKPTYRTPVLVNCSGENRVLINCPFSGSSGLRNKFQLSFVVPLTEQNGKYVSDLPKIIESNFSQAKRTHVRFDSASMLISGNVTRQNNGTYSLEEILKSETPNEASISKIEVQKDGTTTNISVADLLGSGRRWIVQKVESSKNYGPNRLAIVIDASDQMKPHLEDLKKLLSKLPSRIVTTVYLARTLKSTESSVTAKTLAETCSQLQANDFVGGQGNGQVLREAIETIAEKPNGAILWLHGPQPLADQSIASNPFDLGYKTYLYDCEVQPGPDELAKELGIGSVQNTSEFQYKRLHRKSSLDHDVLELLESWITPVSSKVVSRALSTGSADSQMISDATAIDAVNSLWAKEEYSRLSEQGRLNEAEILALNYHILTPNTQIVASLDAAKILSPMAVAPTKKEQQITYIGNTAIATKSEPELITIGGVTQESKTDTYRGLHQYFKDDLVGAPVDRRYGQSNEVGQLADYGYDTARDISRIATALSTLFAIPFGLLLMRKRKGSPAGNVLKGLALAFSIPTVVHLVGTFLINNFGGLGGGL